ncbi:MAG: hypothetical protein KL787_08135 [Taibaiella sp.]|nr:hypothetical protein [Taibaiella sp.]
MESRELRIPLLIGGATTSKVHTAVKIATKLFPGWLTHINDASRAVPVISKITTENEEERVTFIRQLHEEHERVRIHYANHQNRKEMRSIADARAHKWQLGFQ